MYLSPKYLNDQEAIEEIKKLTIKARKMVHRKFITMENFINQTNKVGPESTRVHTAIKNLRYFSDVRHRYLVELIDELSNYKDIKYLPTKRRFINLCNYIIMYNRSFRRINTRSERHKTFLNDYLKYKKLSPRSNGIKVYIIQMLAYYAKEYEVDISPLSRTKHEALEKNKVRNVTYFIDLFKWVKYTHGFNLDTKDKCDFELVVVNKNK